MTRPGLRVRIGRDGRVHAETVGITGEACLDLVPVVEDLVAARVVASAYLPEFFAAGASATAAGTSEEDDDTAEDAARHVPEQEPG